MTRITEELVRKRAEHNDGCLTDLKELTLHQFEIEKIENLGQLCRHLEILFLQNNLISKIENIKKLQQLKYLNLAINNIKKIEGLEYCEALEKLDLTANFVDDLLSVASLEPNYNLKELFLVGNPVTKHPKYRSFIIASVPSLKVLDGQEITSEERAEAKEELSEVRAQLLEEKTKGLTLETPNFTPEDRTKVYKELAEKRGDNNKTTETEKKENVIPPPPAPGEKARGVNQGKLEFKLLEDDNNNIIIDLACGKYLDTSMIQVDAQPTYVRVITKGKLFQLPLPDEVNPDSGTARRSTLTGNLVLTLPKTRQDRKTQTTFLAKKDTDPAPNKATSKPPGEDGGLRGTVDIRNIVKDAKEGKSNPGQTTNETRQSTKRKNDVPFVPDFDESEVPDLE